MSDETVKFGDEASEAEDPNPVVGKVIGGYRLLAPLRSGGMGTVYYGEHTLIGRRAAIKILHPEVSRNPDALGRFLTEARAANDIRHPNVVEITDIGSLGDHAIWRQVVDRSHRNVGVALARRWNLPACVGDAIEKCVGYDHAVPFAPSNLVCLANAFAKVQGLYAGDFDADRVNALLVEGKELLDLPDEALALLCAGLYRRVGSLFDAKPPSR